MGQIPQKTFLNSSNLLGQRNEGALKGYILISKAIHSLIPLPLAPLFLSLEMKSKKPPAEGRGEKKTQLDIICTSMCITDVKQINTRNLCNYLKANSNHFLLP